jgi:anion-transporting  ArsA/GET3 family ATPase
MSAKEAFHYAIIIPLELVKITFTSFVNGLDTAYGAVLLLIKGFYIATEKLTFGALTFTDEMDFVNDQLEGVGQRMLDRAEDVKKSISTITQDPAESARQFSEKLREINEDPNLLGNKYLSDIKDSLLKGEELQRKTSKSVASVDEKTPEPETKSAFVDESTIILSQALETMLGVGQNTTAEEMLEELRVANMQRAQQETGGALAYQRGGLD